MLGKKITSIDNPGPLKIDGMLELLRKNGLYLGVGLIAIMAVLGYAMDYSKSFWQFYLINLYFFLGFSFFGFLFIAIHHAANAVWSTPVRRLAEGLASFFVVGFIMVIPIVAFGTGELYDWTISDVYHHFGASKQMYLTLTAYVVKLAIFFSLLFFMGKRMITNSLKQDESGDINLTNSSRKIAIPFLMLFAFLFTVFVVDVLLAIDSKWFSTMFGVYCFAGVFVSGYAFLSIVTVQIKKNGELQKSVPKHILKDLGTYTMGFSAFFAYIGFSQFMLIWYANMPAETFYFMTRSANGWGTVFVLIAVFKFIIPFVFLMPWGMRSNPFAFKLIGGIIILGQWLDIVWMVMPTMESPFLSIVFALVLFVAFMALFFHSILGFYHKHSVLAHKDPRLLTSINGEHL